MSNTLVDTSRRAGGTVYLHYAANTDFDSGVVFAKRIRDNNTVSQTFSSAGTLTITGLLAGEEYAFWAVPYDATPEPGALSNILFLEFAGPTDYGNKYLDIKYRSDKRDWRSTRIGTDTDRRRVTTNMAGHWFQYELTCDAPNQRISLQSQHHEERVRGRRMNVSQ